MPERVQRNLDEDQLQRAWMRNGHGDFEQALLISESSVYAVLIHYYHPENRCIRHWLTREVIPRLREVERFDGRGPYREVIRWRERELEVLHWQGKAWLQLDEFPPLLQRPPLVIG
ncbi:hypothetical protein D3C85_1256160 [compost metagenome]